MMLVMLSTDEPTLWPDDMHSSGSANQLSPKLTQHDEGVQVL